MPVKAVTIESARYRLSGASPWRTVHAVENPGYRVVLSARDGVALEARVEVDSSSFPDRAPFPVPVAALPGDAQRILHAELPADPEAEALSRLLTRGAASELQAIERVIAYTSRRIRYALPSGSPETAASCRRSGRGSCVGRSLLAADLLIRSGIPARQVTGVLTARSVGELSAESRPAFSEELGGVRHRWIEAYVPRLGWVPSDPGGLANALTAQHLAFSGPPPFDLAVETVSRTGHLAWPALPALGPGVTLARPRSPASLELAR